MSKSRSLPPQQAEPPRSAGGDGAGAVAAGQRNRCASAPGQAIHSWHPSLAPARYAVGATGRTLTIQDMIDRVRTWLTHPRLPILLAALGVLIVGPALWGGLAFDDYLHRAAFLRPDALVEARGHPLNAMFVFGGGSAEQTARLVGLGYLPWWTPPGARISFWRPATALTHWLDHACWPDCVWLMHLHSLLWYGALLGLATVLYRRMGEGRYSAGLAALFYAVAYTNLIPAAWLANRSSVLAALCCVGALLGHDTWRKTGRPRWAVLATTGLAIGLLAKEAAVATCGYLLAYAVCIDRGSRSQRVLSLVPYGAVVLAWRTIYQAMGYGIAGSPMYIDPSLSPGRFLVGLIQRLPILIFSRWSALPAGPLAFVHPWMQWVVGIVSVALLLPFIWLLQRVVRRSRVNAFWCFGMVLSAVPACAVFPSIRVMLFVGLGTCALMAEAVLAVGAGLYATARRPIRMWARSLSWFLIVVHLILSPLLLLGGTIGMSRLTKANDWVLHTLKLPDDVADKTLVAVNTPLVNTVYAVILRALEGETVPARLRNMSTSLFRMPPAEELTRTDENTLVLRSSRPLRWILIRDHSQPMSPGDRVELTGAQIEVTEATPDGYPTEMAYRFDVSLDHPSLIWRRMRNWRFEPFAPPPVGQSVMVTPQGS